jgi:hypothetical protein
MRTGGWTAHGGVLMGLVALAVASPSGAQDLDSLARVLREGRADRVRVQAAFALGGTGEAAAVPPLVRALRRDGSDSVRAAAAGALGRLGSPRALGALRRAQEDRASAVRKQATRSIRAIERRRAEARRAKAPAGRKAAPAAAGRGYPAVHVVPTEEQVRWSRVRHVVALGDMGNRSGFAGPQLAAVLHGAVAQRLGALREVYGFDASAGLDERARREVRRRRIPLARIEGNVVKVQPRLAGREHTVRCEVSLMLLKEPGRTMQGMMSGAATGADRRGRDLARQRRHLAEQAVAGAVQSAMARIPSALRRAAGG